MKINIGMKAGEEKRKEMKNAKKCESIPRRNKESSESGETALS